MFSERACFRIVRNYINRGEIRYTLRVKNRGAWKCYCILERNTSDRHYCKMSSGEQRRSKHPQSSALQPIVLWSAAKPAVQTIGPAGMAIVIGRSEVT